MSKLLILLLISTPVFAVCQESNDENLQKLKEYFDSDIYKNCGSTALWAQYQANGITMKNCEEWKERMQKDADTEGDPNLPYLNLRKP